MKYRTLRVQLLTPLTFFAIEENFKFFYTFFNFWNVGLIKPHIPNTKDYVYVYSNPGHLISDVNRGGYVTQFSDIIPNGKFPLVNRFKTQ